MSRSGVDESRDPHVFSAYGRARTHHYRICGCPEQTHNEAVSFVRTANRGAPRLARYVEAYHPIECRDEICNHI